MTHLYRYEITHDYERVRLYLDKLEILRETPCGYWVKFGYKKDKWISKNARNSYAQITEREALKHFVRRKTYRNLCIEREMERNDVALRLAKETIKKGDDEQRKTGITKGSYSISKISRIR